MMKKHVKFFRSLFTKVYSFWKSRKRVSYLLVIGLGLQSHSFFAQSYSCGQDKVLICHKGKNILCISINALQAHLDHGDHLGSCTGTECGVAASGGEITCSNPLITLSSISNTSELSYHWTGPGNFTSTLSRPTVSIPGTYIVNVTNATGGCSASDTAVVTQNTESPIGVNITGSEMLTCFVNSVKLSGHSTTAGVSYDWSGPSGFVSTSQNIKTSLNGVYSLLVKNPVNGCTSIANTTIAQDTSSATEVNVSVSGTLTCAKNSVILKGTSITSGVAFKWIGPNGFSAESQNTNVYTPGIYILRVTKPGNNCSIYRTIKVQQNKADPEAVTASASDILSVTPIVTLIGSSTTPGVIYSWVGPSGYSSSLKTPTVNMAGSYSLTVTNTGNGCSVIAAVDVN